MKLKNKLFLIITLITLIPSVCITFITYKEYLRLMNNHMQVIAENQYDNIYSTIQEQYNDIRHAINLLTFYSAEDSSILSTLRNLEWSKEEITDRDLNAAGLTITPTCLAVMYNQPAITSIHVFTSDRRVFGHSRYSTIGISADYDPVNDPWYQDTLALNGSLYISEPGYFEMFTSGDESIIVSCLIRDVDRNFRSMGVLVLELNPDFFNLDQQNTLDDISFIQLSVASSGNILYQSAEKASGSSSVFSVDSKSTSESVFTTPLVLTMTLDYSLFSSEYSSTLSILILLALINIICIFLLMFLITREIIVPIQKLSDKMLLDPNTPIAETEGNKSREDEIGILYRQYDHMIEENQKHIKNEYQNKLILLDSQMKALEARINSHFLFNTLESINSMAELADQPQISVMSLSLGRMFRYAIKTDSELVSLRDEIRHIRDYITIQLLRCSNRFHFILDVPEEHFDLKVLKLIFQPLIENSLIHGLEYGNSGDTITLSSKCENDLLICTIMDNGKGISEDSLAEIRQNLNGKTEFVDLGHRSKESIGLKNIHSRIELYYGKGYGLTVESKEGSGTKIQITIPYSR